MTVTGATDLAFLGWIIAAVAIHWVVTRPLQGHRARG